MLVIHNKVYMENMFSFVSFQHFRAFFQFFPAVCLSAAASKLFFFSFVREIFFAINKIWGQMNMQHGISIIQQFKQLQVPK